MKLMRRTVLVAVLLPLVVAGVALAQKSSDEVRAAIEEALDEEDIELGVTVEGGTVILEGGVRNVFQKNRAVEIALEQPGVEAVEADVEIAAAESDEDLGAEVVKQLRRYSRFTVFDDASAYVQDGKVVLVGWVTDPYKKTELANQLRDVLGIQEFENRIEVLPASTADERLRRTLWRRLYGDSTFSDYRSMAIPPIHIIVSRSRVILTGVVRNQLMKQKAESIIRQTPGVLSVESRLRIGS